MSDGDKNNFLNRLIPIGLFLLCFVFCYHVLGGLSSLHDFRIRGQFEFEKAIPFIPWMIVVYWSIAIQFVALPFVFRNTAELSMRMNAMMIATVIAVVFFIILPFENSLVKNVYGVWVSIFQMADTVNLDRNFFPSLHCCYGVMMASYFQERLRFFGRLLIWIWTISIMSSTLLIHEHYVVDVIGGIILACFSLKLFYRRSIRVVDR